jgi:phosphoribosylaminoimidazole (AIR) synthetase
MKTLTTIDTNGLESVTGGATQRTSSRNTTDERLTAKLDSITTAIKDVASQQKNQNNDPMSQMMPILAMGMMKRR